MSKSYSPAQYAPVETRDLKHSPNCVFYVNGDSFFPGSRLCISNRIRTFDGVKEELTKSLFKNSHQTGHVRNIFTPVGGSKVKSLDDLKDGEHYVAALNDKFKPLPYKEIPERQRIPRQKGFKKIDITRIYTPVQHALEERLRKKSGRSYYLNEHRRGLRLRVHVNGQSERPFCPVSIRYKDKDNWFKILEEIERTLNLQPVERVYKIKNQGGYIENFEEISSAENLSPDEHVLVLPKNDRRLQPKYYTLEGKNNFKVTTSPRVGQYYLYPAFPADNNVYKHNKSLNKHRPLPSIGSSSKQSEPMSPFSNPPQSQAGRKSNSVKSKGSKQVDYDQDTGGVYRAKKQNNTRGAQQVNDTRDTHVDRPIDQMEAEIVEEEDFSTKEKTTPIPPGTELNKQPSKELKDSPGTHANGSQTGDNEVIEQKDPFKQLKVLPPIHDQDTDETDRMEVKSKAKSMASTEGDVNDTQVVKQMNVTIKTAGNNVDKTSIKDGHVKETVEKFEEFADEREETPADLKFTEMNAELDAEADDVVPSPKDRSAEEAGMHSIDEYADDSLHNYDRNSVAPNTEPRSSTPATRGVVQTPASKGESRKEQEQKDNEAATRIQAGFKGYNTRKQFKEQKEQQKQKQAQKQAQSDTKQKQMNEDMAASKIQASFKGYKTRKELNVKKQQVRDDIDRRERIKRENEAATSIQSGFRGYKTRKEFKEKQDRLQADMKAQSVKGTDINDNEKKTDRIVSDEKAREDAATKIQSNYRGYKTRKDLKQKKESMVNNDTTKNDKQDNEHKEMTEDEAASNIQASFKGYNARKEFASKPSKIEEDSQSVPDKELDEAASTIQANYKGYKARKEYETNKQKQHEDKAATKIQANYRGYKTRKELTKRKEQQQMPDPAPSPKTDPNELDQAATTIQSGFRGYKVRKEFKTKVKGHEIVETDLDQLPESVCTNVSAKKSQFLLVSEFINASNIQRAFRCFGKREDIRESYFKNKNYFQAFSGNDDEMNEVVEKQTKAAVKIQSFYRKFKSKANKVCLADAVNLIQNTSKDDRIRKHEHVARYGHFMSFPNMEHYSSVIQSLCRGFMTRRDYRISCQNISARTGTEKVVPTVPVCYWKDSNIKMYTDRTLRKSATKIQTAIHGYQSRKEYKERKQIELGFCRENASAAILQAYFRGHLVRKQFVDCRTGKTECESKENEDRQLNEEWCEPVNYSSRLNELENESRTTLSSGPGSSLKSVSLYVETEKEQGRDSGFSMSTVKDSEVIKIRKRKRSVQDGFREIEIDKGEQNVIENHVHAINQLQAACKAYQLRTEFRRELSELKKGRADLVDIETVSRDISSLRKDFQLKSAKIRRLGTRQFYNLRKSEEAVRLQIFEDKGHKKMEELNSLACENRFDTNPESTSHALSGEEVEFCQKSFSPEKVFQLKASFFGHAKRNKKLEEKLEHARHQILAAFRGYKTRKTQCREHRNKNVKHAGDMGRTDIRIKGGEESPANGIINKRATHLQAAIAGYQTRKVFISLTELVEHSDNDLGRMHLTKIGSLSETDDFKLRHKSMTKNHSQYMINKVGFEAKTELVSSGLTKEGPCSDNNSRPASGVLHRNHLNAISFNDVKSRTQPDLLDKTKSFTTKLSGIEVYIRKKVAASRVQSYARSWMTREKMKAIKNSTFKDASNVTKGNNVSKSSFGKETDSQTQCSSSKTTNLKTFSENLGPNSPSKYENTMNSYKTNKTRKKKSLVTFKERKSTISTITPDQKADDRTKVDTSELMRSRTASIKLEAQKRKALAQQARHKYQSVENEENVKVQENSTALTQVHSEPRLGVDPEISQNVQVNSNNMERAAIAIQKVFRGYMIRKNVVNKLKVKQTLEKEYIGWRSKRIKAAVAIQSVWRGYLVRKELQDHSESGGDVLFQHKMPDLIVINIGRSQSEIDRANRRYENACMIQMTVRTCQTRRNYGMKFSRRRQCKSKAASKIQAIYKGYLTRKQLKAVVCATRIQSICKAFKTRKIQAEKNKQKLAAQHASASRLQAVYHSFIKRRQNNAEKNERERHRSVINIQKAVRGYITRWDLCEKQGKLHHVAANKIHQSFRGYKARKEKRNIKETRQIIFASYRAFKTRQEIEAYLKKLKEERKAATKLQSFYKGHCSRRRYHEQRLKLLAENKATAVIQFSFQSVKTRKNHSLWLEERAKQRELAAVKVQSYYRGHLGRKKALNKRLRQKREKSAMRIQSVYRGYIGRKEAKKERHIRDVHAMAATIVNLLVSRVIHFCTTEKDSSEHMVAAVQGFHKRLKMINSLSDAAKLRLKERKILASVIQIVVRAKQRRDKVMSKADAAKRNEAAKKIQSLYRGYKARKDIRTEWELLANIEPPGPMVVSARTRSGTRINIPVNGVLSENSRAVLLFHKKATELQAAFRAFNTRRETRKRLARKARNTYNAQYQNFIAFGMFEKSILKSSKELNREVSSRSRNQERKSSRSGRGDVRIVLSASPQHRKSGLIPSKGKSNEENAAVLIQKAFRKYQARKLYESFMSDRRKVSSEAASVLQAVCKGYLVRCFERQKEGMYEMERKTERDKMKHQASSIIAAAYRNHFIRQNKIDQRAEM